MQGKEEMITEDGDLVIEYFHLYLNISDTVMMSLVKYVIFIYRSLHSRSLERNNLIILKAIQLLKSIRMVLEKK